MLIRTVAFLATLPLQVKIAWRNFQCRRFGKIARTNEELVCDLGKYILGRFITKDKTVNYIEYHRQFSLGYPTKENGERFSEICWEAPICFTIFREGKPLVGMGVEFRGSILCIWQLQGVSGAKIPKAIQRWPALFVEAVQKFAQERSEVSVVRLYAADQRLSYANPTLDLDVEEAARYRQNLRRRYDGTARQRKFKKKHKRYWVWEPATK
jgi:hypothetical protein